MNPPEPVLEFFQRFQADLRRFELPGRARGFLIGASGGPDSTALCRLVALSRDRMKSGISWPPIWLGHVHHGMRGEDADGDAQFARNLADMLGFQALEARVDVPSLARSEKISLEAAARAARYNTFSRWTREYPIDTVLLAHTASDQVETVLLRFLRCAGLRGLGGMPAERPLHPNQVDTVPRLIRPLLGWSRREILSLLSHLGQPFREDLSNRDPSHLRNRVRHHLLPLLRSDFNPAMDRTILEIGRILRGAAGDLEQIARGALARALVRQIPDLLEMETAALRDDPDTIRLLVLELAAIQFFRGRGENPPALSPRRLIPIIEWLGDNPEERRSLEIGRGLRAELGGGLIRLLPGGPRAFHRPPPPVPLLLPGVARWGSWEVRAELAGPPVAGQGSGPPEADNRLCEYVDRESLSKPLQVRGRRKGDRMRPLGAPGAKKIKEFFRERNVPPELRDGVPLVADSSGIVWVVGHRIADNYRIGPGTREMVRFTAIQR